MIFANPHRRLDGWIRDNPRKIDFTTGLIYTLFCLPATLSVAGSWSTSSVLAITTLSLLQTVPLMYRRRFPWQMTLVVVLGHILQLAFDGLMLPSQVSVPIMIYTMAVYGKRWQSFFTLALGLLGALLATFSMFNPSRYLLGGSQVFSFDMMISFVGLALIVTLSWTFGDLARTRRLAVQSLKDHADRLEKERTIERALAASDERNHIAREMHDIVAHSLSVIITQANGARYAAAKDPDIAVETLKTISDTGRESLKEMRRLLGVLRKDDELENRPLPSLDNVSELIDTAAGAGLDVQFQISGTPRKELPAGAELTVYRCIQEALTNVIKHAGPEAHAKVDIDWTGRGVNLVVQDDGRGAGSLTFDGPGQGLLGMKERVALYQGTCTARPHAGGGFTVSAFIPYTED